MEKVRYTQKEEKLLDWAFWGGITIYGWVIGFVGLLCFLVDWAFTNKPNMPFAFFVSIMIGTSIIGTINFNRAKRK